jgi:hypothetical protein
MSLASAKAAAVAHYPLDEASGNAIDSIGAIDLTETGGTIATTTGKFGDCRDFEAGDTEYFESSDNATLSMGDILMFATVWVNAESIGSFPIVFRKGDEGSFREYVLFIDTSDGNKPTFAATAIDFAKFGSGISTSTWHLLCCRHDPTANTLAISLDGGNFVTASYSAGLLDSAGVFQLGAGTDQGLYWDGLIEDLVIGKGYEFTNADAAELWDSGTGVAFEDWDAAAVTQVTALSLMGTPGKPQTFTAKTPAAGGTSVSWWAWSTFGQSL